MNTALAIIGIAIALMLTMGLILSVYLIVISNKFTNKIVEEMEKRRKLKEAELYSELFRASSSINELLDTFVSETLDEYKILHPEIFSVDYLSESIQEKIRSDVYIEINKKMSPALINQLNIIFNKNALPEIINHRVIMAIVAMSVEFNTDDVNMSSVFEK